MGRHEGHDTFGAIADDYVTGRAKELVRQIDMREVGPANTTVLAEWVGAAAEILRELTRDA